MELITNWEVFNAASLAFCQFQGLLGIIAITGIVIFKHNLGERMAIFKSRGGDSDQVGNHDNNDRSRSRNTDVYPLGS